MATAYIGLGSNLNDPAAQLRQACRALGGLPQSRLEAVSPFYRNRPMGPQDQPDYVNAVARLETTLEPLALLDALHAIEVAQGRMRDGTRWGARTLDLDLLLYDELSLSHARLHLPHPGMGERDFVILPLCDVAPAGLSIPGLGPLAALRERFSAATLTRLELGHE